MTYAIRVENLSKQYRLGASQGGGYRTLRESLSGAARRTWDRARLLPSFGQADDDGAAPAGRFWALDDVSFDVEPGEVVGIIGRNGAGKSTLLKILSRITEPTEGRAMIRGRMGSLLEVGTGFHQELSGRENIYLNGAILGMPQREIVRKFDEIVEFAGVDRFVDTPVKRYSSGMYVRLAFAVAAHLDPEILIIDEVLAVGDHEFQRKCLGKLGEASQSGRTVLLVSHNMAAVQSLCKKVIVLKEGRIKFIGGAEQGIEVYGQESGFEQSGEVDLTNHRGRTADSFPLLASARLIDSRGVTAASFSGCEPLTIEIEAQPSSKLPSLHFGIEFEDGLGGKLFTVGSFISRHGAFDDSGESLRVRCRLNRIPLPPGHYRLSFFAGPPGRRKTDWVRHATGIEVTSSDYYGNGYEPDSRHGAFLMRSAWERVHG